MVENKYLVTYKQARLLALTDLCVTQVTSGYSIDIIIEQSNNIKRMKSAAGINMYM